MNTQSKTATTYTGFFSKTRLYSGNAPLLVALGFLIVIAIFAKNISEFIGVSILFSPLILPLVLFNWVTLNQFPVIRTTEKGLSITHNFSHLFIPWKEIEAVRGDKRFALGRVYVYSHALPSLYRLYALEQLQSIPAFVIDPTMKEHDLKALVYTIEKHSRLRADILY